MSTNFYLKAKPACAHCGRGPDEGLHIGKSSAGWAFGLRIYPRGACQLQDFGVEQIATLDDWRPLFERYGIINEYGEDVSVDQMLTRITKRGEMPRLRRHHELAAVYRVEILPDETYDLIEGEFS